MNKILIIASLLIMASCTLSGGDTYEHPNLSGEVPQEAKTVDGYDYPAIPLDEFNKMQENN
jgi:hypothetical protein